MIITKEIEVTISSSNIKHYMEQVGYEPKRYIDSSGKERFKKETITVKIEDLPPRSNIKIEVTCDNCGGICTKSYDNVKKHKSFCNAKCKNEYISNQFLKEFENKIGEDAKTFLEREYIQNKKPFRKISMEVFGNDSYRNSLAKWCNKLGVKIRNRSEAIETQWINNPNRRKQQAELFRENIGIEGIKKDFTIPELRKTSNYQEWRLKVYARDNFTCVKCGKPRDYKTKLNAHHLDSFMYNEKLRYDVNNGVTLCQSCHIEFHAKYTNRNNTKEQFEEFLKTK